MQFQPSPLALVGALLAAAAVGLASSQNGVHATQNNHHVPYQDDDQDGLDNALEVRLGTNPFQANVDGDSLNDLSEILLGTNPIVPDANSSLPTVGQAVRLEAYQIGGAFVLQSFMVRKQRVQSVHFYVAQKDPMQINNPVAPPLVRRLGTSAYAPYMDRFETLPMAHPNFDVTSMRLVLPLAPFQASEAFSVAIVAVLDNGVKVADEVRFTTMNGMLVEWREGAVLTAGIHSLQGGGSNSGGQPGGLFPADPSANVPLGENSVNQVCVQTLGAVGLHGIGVVYSVVEAACDTLFGAVCLSSCSFSVGESFVGLDLPSLLQ